MKIEIHIKVRRAISDPQGTAIKKSLQRLNMDCISDVRQDKIIELDLNTEDKEFALQLAETACKELLANPITEDYQIKIL